MNYRDTSNETSALWSVDAIEDMAFLQAANKEAFAHGVLAQIGNSYNQANMYVLWGCVNTGTYPAYDISEGAVYYRSAAAIAANLPGEIYTVDHTVFTVTSPHVAVAKVTATSDGDMRLFSDGLTRPVTMINKVLLSEGASGSGDVDYANFIFLPINKKHIFHNQNSTSSFNFSTLAERSSNQTSVLDTMVTPNDGITRTWEIEFKAALNFVAGSGHNNFDGSIMIALGSSPLTLPGSTGSLDVSQSKLVSIASTGAEDIRTCYCKTIQTLAPNTTISFQLFLAATAPDVFFTSGTAIMKEI